MSGKRAKKLVRNTMFTMLFIAPLVLGVVLYGRLDNRSVHDCLELESLDKAGRCYTSVENSNMVGHGYVALYAIIALVYYPILIGSWISANSE